MLVGARLGAGADADTRSLEGHNFAFLVNQIAAAGVILRR